MIETDPEYYIRRKIMRQAKKGDLFEFDPLEFDEKLDGIISEFNYYLDKAQSNVFNDSERNTEYEKAAILGNYLGDLFKKNKAPNLAVKFYLTSSSCYFQIGRDKKGKIILRKASPIARGRKDHFSGMQLIISEYGVFNKDLTQQDHDIIDYVIVKLIEKNKQVYGIYQINKILFLINEKLAEFNKSLLSIGAKLSHAPIYYKSVSNIIKRREKLSLIKRDSMRRLEFDFYYKKILIQKKRFLEESNILDDDVLNVIESIITKYSKYNYNEWQKIEDQDLNINKEMFGLYLP